MGNKINIDVWKTKLNPNPNSPIISVISLFDLLFYEEKGLVKLRTEVTSGNTFTVNKGVTLDHDIITFYQPMYSSIDGTLDTNLESIANLWFDKGFDIALPKYDSRANRRFIEINNPNFLGTSVVMPKLVPKNRDVFKNITEGTKKKDLYNSKIGFWIYDKESIQKYETTEAFTQNSISLIGETQSQENLKQSGLLFEDSDQPDNSKFKQIFGGAGAIPLRVTAGSTRSSIVAADIMVLDSDPIFEETMSMTNQNTPHLLFAVGQTEPIMNLILETLGISLIPGNDFNKFFSSLISVVLASGSNSSLEANSLVLALKNNYCLVRCSFFADYVDPDDFNQSLEQTSNVEFGNLYIKNSSGDFYKYDTAVAGYKSGGDGIEQNEIMDNHKAVLTRAFMPQTAPIVDLASDAIYKEGIDHKELSGYETPGVEEESVKGTIKEKFMRLVDSSDWPNSPIGSVYIDPISKESKESLDSFENVTSETLVNDKTRLKNIGNPAYFDPESRKDVEDYTLEEWERLPVLLHKKGNIMIDGRLLSVTTDELWTAIKKIIVGRRPDTDDSSVNVVDEGIPFNSDVLKENDKDTRLVEITNNEFKFLYEKDETHKKGDPIRVAIAPNSENRESLIVEMFVNNNDTIKYTIYEAIHRLDKSVVKWDKSAQTIEDKTRSVKQFTPWKINSRDSVESDKVLENNIETGEEWAPRKIPLSLRELEAGVLQNKFNIISLARYLKENFMVSGKLGRTIENTLPYGSEEDVIVQTSAGSIYQAHKDYNYIVDNPNTVFNINRENATDDILDNGSNLYLGRGAIFADGDYRGRIEYSSELFNSRYDEAVYSTGQRYHSVNGYELSEVYLAADGTWRYIHDHVRSPILKTKY